MRDIPLSAAAVPPEDSRLLPVGLRGKPTDLHCILRLADRLDEEPLAVMHNLRFSDGELSWAPRYVVARANRSDVFLGRLSWITASSESPLSVTACARLADSGEEVRVTADAETALEEGWIEPGTPPHRVREFLHWHTAAQLVDLYAPDLLGAIPPAHPSGITVLAPSDDSAERTTYTLRDEYGRPVARRSASPNGVFEQLERLMSRAENPVAVIEANIAVLAVAATELENGPQRVTHLWRTALDRADTCDADAV